MTSRTRVPFLFSLILVLILMTPGFSAGASEEAAAAGGRFVRIPASAVADAALLGLNPRLALDYGSFHWLELNESDFNRLAASGIPYAPEPDAGQVRVPNYRFDPVADGEPTLPAAMQSTSSGAGFRLIQLAGPTNDAWLKRVEATGLKLLQYYPHHSYLVWGTAAQAEAAGALEFARWQGAFHPAYKVNSDLVGRSGRVSNVDVFFYNDGDINATLTAIRQAGGRIIQSYPAQPDKAFHDAIVELDAAAVNSVALLNSVLWLGYSSPQPQLDDEMSDQIIAGNYTAGVPFPGYNDYLNDLGYDGTGVIWSITDTGVDYDHPDLGPHIVGGHTYPGAPGGDGPGDDACSGGHGTHVAGIVGGDATAGFTDPNGFLYGLGVAPGYSIFAQNSLCFGVTWPPPGGWEAHSKWAVLGGAVGGNNSWTTGEGENHGYQASERTHDIMVRDGNFDTTTVAEPGEEIASAANDGGGSCASPGIPGTGGLYAYCTGTSMAAPHVSGSITVITEWWRTFNGGADPSPAMAKALLVNGSTDMGTADRWNKNEGWGRVYLPDTIAPDADAVYRDQIDLFGATGETYSLTVGVPDPSKPLKITVAWSDAPGAVGANPALVNNLDLTVVNGSDTYLGNVFSAGWSATGGSPDVLNNLENVFVQTPAGSATITVNATNIAGDGVPYNADATDQDFALVCTNCALEPDFTLTATPSTQDICVPSNAVYSVAIGSILGYNNPVTMSASGQPAGTTANFNPGMVTPPGNSTLTIGNTAAAAPGTYTIKVTGTSSDKTHDVNVTLNVATAAPSQPALVSPPNGATNQSLTPTFEWNASAQATSYDLQVATDPQFSNVVYSVNTTDTTHTMDTALEPETTYYWRVRGRNACGAGQFASAFSFTTRAIPPILLVDDDDNSPDVRATYESALGTMTLSYDVWDTQNSDNEPDAVTLAPYKIVIWFTGVEFGGAAGPGPDGETALGSWLDSGSKCLFLSSQDYYYDRGLTTFMQTYLGLAAAQSDVSQTQVQGFNVFTGLGRYTLDYPFTNYSDRLQPDATAQLAFRGDQGRAAILKPGPGGNYLTTFLGFPWEAIPNPAERVQVLNRITGPCQ